MRRGVIIGVFFSDNIDEPLPVIGSLSSVQLCVTSGTATTTQISCENNMSPDLVIRGTAQIGELNKNCPKITGTSWIVHDRCLSLVLCS